MNRSLNFAKRVFGCRARMNCYLPKFRIVMKSNGDITDNKISRSNQIPNAASLPSFVAISDNDVMNKFPALNLYKYTSIDTVIFMLCEFLKIVFQIYKRAM